LTQRAINLYPPLLRRPSVNPNPSWIERVVYDLGKNLPPVRRAFIYLLLNYSPENPGDDRPILDEYLSMVDRAIEDATQAFEGAEDPAVKAEWRMRVSVLKELRERFLRLFRDRKGVSLISLGRDLRESERDPELDKLMMDIMVRFNDSGIPHDLVPAGFLVLEEDYDDALKIVVDCVQTAMAKLAKERHGVAFAKVMGFRKVRFPSSE
jgi:hypothetical protein